MEISTDDASLHTYIQSGTFNWEQGDADALISNFIKEEPSLKVSMSFLPCQCVKIYPNSMLLLS
jgi:hypothetical protein